MADAQKQAQNWFLITNGTIQNYQQQKTQCKLRKQTVYTTRLCTLWFDESMFAYGLWYHSGA